ncbi:MAG: polysaccharide deacetylase family protein [Nitrosopumilus sp.]|nr:polysaccharide deacetylase family protein [Nitrosopumilus sp.]
MKLVYLGGISTSIVLILGLIMVLPPFLQPEPKQQVLLSFSISDSENLSHWCDELSSILFKEKIKAAVFISGEFAKEFPQCVTSFSNDIDIGSQAFHYSPITKISAYSLQLDEIQKGKKTIDEIGNLDTKLFKAPYGKTDDNIYSLLSHSDIQADFSYKDQYNKFHEDQFIWFKIKSYDSSDYANSITPIISNIESQGKQIPIVINFDEKISIEEIDEILIDLKSKNFEFVNASDLVGYDLTKRNDGQREST